jgi:AcrR family transcriptional regulator
MNIVNPDRDGRDQGSLVSMRIGEWAAPAIREEALAQLRIRRVALRLFAERGYSDVGVAEIVEACELTKGAFYYYYQSKEDLFRTLVTAYTESWERRVMEAVPPGAAWDEQLAAVFRVFIEVLERADDPHRDLLVLMTLRGAGGPGQHELGFASLRRFAAWIEAVMATHPNGARRREYAALVHAAGLGVLSEAAFGAHTARPVLSAVLEVLGGGPLYPTEVELRGSHGQHRGVGAGRGHMESGGGHPVPRASRQAPLGL